MLPKKSRNLRARFRTRIPNRLFVRRIGFRRTRTRDLFELQRCRSLIEAVRGNLRTNRSDCYTGSIRVRENARTKWCTKAGVGALLTLRIVVSGGIGDHGRTTLSLPLARPKEFQSASR